MLVELRHPVRSDRRDHLIHEFLAGSIDDPHTGAMLHKRPADGVHQMRFPHADAAVNEKRIIAVGRMVSDRAGGRVSELITRANYKRIKAIARIQLAGWRGE